jgi:hypothetical protein
MKLSNRRRITGGTTITATAIAFVSSLAFAAPAQANPVCYQAGVSGTITGTHDTPRVCEPTNLSVVCTTPSASLLPTIEVHAEACVPV